MKIKRLTDCFLLLLAAGMLVACSSNDDNKENNGTDDGKKVNIAKAVTFKVDFADYNAEQEVGVTRAGNQEEKIGRQVIGLGNGILAQCTLQRDTTKQLKTIATRALPDDTYTMLAYDVATHTLRGELIGNVVGGVFRYSSFGAIEIPAGTYDFVLFNSKVSRSGNLLTVTRANAGDALIGRTTGKVIPASPYNQLVTFTMKHVAAKVKVKLTGYMPATGVTATLASVNATDVPSSSVYDALTGTWSLGTGAATSDALTYGASQQSPIIPGVGRTYTANSTEDAFFMPSTDVSKLKLSFTAGNIYNLNMAGKSLTFAPKTPLQLDQNGSYVLNINLMYRFLYLMSDGSTGFIEKTTFGGAPAATAKTPIAVVISQSKHMAVALKTANNGALMGWCDNDYYSTRANTYSYPTKAAAAAGPSGFEETWNAAYSKVGVKANNGYYYAFYAAAHYDPGVTYTGTPALQWYLPSMSDWAVAHEVLGFGDKSVFATTGTWYTGLFSSAFIQVGANITPGLADMYYGFWTSTEATSISNIFGVYIAGNHFSSRTFSKSATVDKKRVLPFVKY